ncbi:MULTISPECIES: hypothetical protein [unclassified Methylobacterium]|nr:MULTISPECIES: hypothetical protein [unclassified Methylobacterium]
MFGMFTRRSEDEQKRKREAEDHARRARFEECMRSEPRRQV